MYDTDDITTEELNNILADALREQGTPEDVVETAQAVVEDTIGEGFNNVLYDGNGDWGATTIISSDGLQPIRDFLTEPEAPNVGDVYFDSETRGLMMWNGIEWYRMMPEVNYERGT